MMPALVFAQALMMLVMTTYLWHVYENELWPIEQEEDEEEQVALNPDGTLPEDE